MDKQIRYLYNYVTIYYYQNFFKNCNNYNIIIIIAYNNIISPFIIYAILLIVNKI